MLKKLWVALLAAGWISSGLGAKADRNILAPRALTTPAESPRFEGLFRGQNTRNYLSWANIGFNGNLIGLEMEVERFELGNRRSEALSFQYSLTGNAFTDLAPAIAVGARDILRTGRDKQAIYGVATKSFGLSRAQEQLFRDFKVHLGVGTSTLGGLFGGVQSKFRAGFTLQAEVVSTRINASLLLPLPIRGLQVKGASLNGSAFYGAVYTLKR